jgi:hypothetical protein
MIDPCAPPPEIEEEERGYWEYWMLFGYLT